MARLSIMDGILKEGYRNDKTLEIVAKRTLYFRNEGNIFYQIRTDILLIGAAITIFLFGSTMINDLANTTLNYGDSF